MGPTFLWLGHSAQSWILPRESKYWEVSKPALGTNVLGGREWIEKRTFVSPPAGIIKKKRDWTSGCYIGSQVALFRKRSWSSARPEGTNDKRVVHSTPAQRPSHSRSPSSWLCGYVNPARACSGCGVVWCVCVRASGCVCVWYFSCSAFSVLFVTKLGSWPPLIRKMVTVMFHNLKEERLSPVHIAVVWTNSKSSSQHWRIIFTTVAVLLRPILPVFNLSFWGLERNTHWNPILMHCVNSQPNPGSRTLLIGLELSSCNWLFRFVADLLPSN